MRLLFALTLACFALPAPAHAEALVLHATRIYPAPDADPIDDGVILMREGKIVAVGSRKSLQLPDGTTRSQCAAGVVMAGFQNSHVHFTEPHWNDAAKQPAEELSKHLQAMLTRYGFTTVVDVASVVDNTLALRDRIERGEIPGPRILSAGIPIYPHNGIPIYLRDLPPEFLAQLPQPATAEEALGVVRHNLNRGADATKLFVATPQGGGKIKYMPREIARAAAQETHKRQRLVFAHPSTLEGIRIAIDSGADVLMHTTIEDQKTVWDQGLIKDLLAHDMAVVPTLQLWPYEMAKARLAQGIVELATGDAVEQLRDFSLAGGQVLFGTDVGYMIVYDPTDEYLLMARALSPMEILASLTTAPAARWKEDERRGRIAAGLDADLVVLGEDPTRNPRHFSKVRCTIRGGRVTYASP